MLLRVLASGRPSRRALNGAPQNEVNSDTTPTLTACETNSALILSCPPAGPTSCATKFFLQSWGNRESYSYFRTRRPPTEVGLARLRQRESVEIGNSRFRWAAISKDGRFRRLLTLTGLTALLHMSSPARAAESDLIEQGRDLYADTCAACHGRDMVNAGGIAFDLRRFPKDDFARFRNSVLNGKGEAMPAWRDKIDDNDLAALWAYVRSGG
jgi:mono/diheme cytochrome c family protein